MAIGRKIRKQSKVHWLLRKVYMKVTGKMINEMEKVFRFMLMVAYMMAIGKGIFYIPHIIG